MQIDIKEFMILIYDLLRVQELDMQGTMIGALFSLFWVSFGSLFRAKIDFSEQARLWTAGPPPRQWMRLTR